MKKRFFLFLLFVCGIAFGMDKKGQNQSDKKEVEIKIELLYLYLKTVGTKRQLADFIIKTSKDLQKVNKEGSDIASEQSRFAENLVKDYARVNEIQVLIMRDLKRNGLDLEKIGVQQESSVVHQSDVVHSLARSKKKPETDDEDELLSVVDYSPNDDDF